MSAPLPIRPVQAFVIYCFFQLLVSYLGGERSLLILLHGRQPIPHPFPFNIFLKPMDISDPWVLLNLKRGILRESAGCGRETERGWGGHAIIPQLISQSSPARRIRPGQTDPRPGHRHPQSHQHLSRRRLCFRFRVYLCQRRVQW